MENKATSSKPTGNKQTKFWVILGVVAVVVIIIVAAVQSSKTGTSGGGSVIPQIVQQNNPATTSDQVAPSKSVTSMATVTPTVVQEAKAVAVGTSLVTKDNQVVTPQGKPVELNVMPSSPSAPHESAPVSLSQVASIANTVKESVSVSTGFVPKSFTVKEGQLVNFVLTSTDSYTHVFLFDDPALTATALGVAGGETRMKSWNAPKKGTYAFHCDIPGHSEVGTMIVQ